MTTPLLLDSLEIRGFRAFSHLRIERLGRVNLIVGKNNVGKTSLLEALWLYVYQGSPEIIWQILEARDERKRPQISAASSPEERRQALIDTSLRNYGLAQYQIPALKYLFYGRRDIREKIELQIGPMNLPEEVLSIGVGYWYVEQSGEKPKPLKFENRHTVNGAFPALAIQMGKQPQSLHLLDNPLLPSPLGNPPLTNCVSVFEDGLGDDEIGELWDSIALTNLEDRVIAALRIIAPEIERLNLVGSQQSSEGWERIPVVKLEGFDEPIPLRSLGEGMNRLFGLALALVNSKDGVLLIDEVESGLHYSVQPDVWRLIFETAHRLNVQVFAATHNWDCIEAFQQAAEENKQEEGVLIRLRNKKGMIVADLFDERDLGIVTREKIEVR